jgi:UPF0755 protein
MKQVIVVTVLLVVLLAAGAAGVALWGYAQFVAPGPHRDERVVVIPPGVGMDGISRRLADAGVIERPLVFRLGTRVMGAARDLKAGEYAVPAGASIRDIVLLLRSGKTVVRRLTVAEGLTVRQIVAEVEATDGLTGETGALPREGSLLPETYHFSYGDRRGALLDRMRQGMARTLAELWPERAEGLPFDDLEKAVTLASIVEKETALPEERRRIAGVFVNRLRRGMRLQSDPTVVYVLTGGDGALGRRLTRDDLEIASPYNTYRHAGLPPGPICNPGRAAIAAVLDPLPTDELYFVADGTGGHVFARTLAEHNRNVAKWRRIRSRLETEARAPE